jgi:hypothetical protein
MGEVTGAGRNESGLKWEQPPQGQPSNNSFRVHQTLVSLRSGFRGSNFFGSLRFGFCRFFQDLDSFVRFNNTKMHHFSPFP